MLFPLDIEYLVDLARQYVVERDVLERRISETRDLLARYDNAARLCNNDDKAGFLRKKSDEEQIFKRLTLLQLFFTWYDKLAAKPNLDCEALRLFAESHACPTEVHYLLLTSYWKTIFTKHLTCEKNAAGVIAVAAEFSESEKFFAFVLWLIEKEISAEVIIQSKIFDYFYSVNCGVDFFELVKLLRIVEYHAKYNEHVKALCDGLVNRPVEIQGFTKVFHNASLSPRDLDDPEETELLAARINDPAHPYFSTNVFGQRFSHAERFNLPERFPELSLPHFFFTTDQQNCNNLLHWLGLLPILKFCFRPFPGRDLSGWIQCFLQIAYTVDKTQCLKDVETFIVSERLQSDGYTSLLEMIAKIISKNDMPQLLESQPFYLSLLFHREELFSEIHEKIPETLRLLMVKERLSTPELELIVMIMNGRIILEPQLDAHVKNFLFNYVIRLSDIPITILPVIRRDKCINLLCQEETNRYLQRLSDAFTLDNPYDSVLEKWSEFLSVVNNMKLIHPNIMAEINYPYDIYNLQLFALMKLYRHSHATLSSPDLHAFLDTLVSANSASPSDDKIRFVCKAMYTISHPNLLKLLHHYLPDKDLTRAMKSADHQVRLVAILYSAQIFTVTCRDAIKERPNRELFLDVMTRLLDARRLNENTVSAIFSCDVFFHHAGVTTTMTADLLITLDEKAFLTKNMRELIRAHQCPRSLYDSLISLANGGITLEIFDRIKERSAPGLFARVFVLLKNAALLNENNISYILNKPEIEVFLFVDVLEYLKKANILNPVHFNTVKNVSLDRLNSLSKAFNVLSCIECNQHIFNRVFGAQCLPLTEANTIYREHLNAPNHAAFFSSPAVNGGNVVPIPVPPPFSVQRGVQPK